MDLGTGDKEEEKINYDTHISGTNTWVVDDTIIYYGKYEGVNGQVWSGRKV